MPSVLMANGGGLLGASGEFAKHPVANGVF
jgi:hypothetical protein